MANENSDVVTITKAELDALKSEAKAATAKVVDELKAEVNTLKAGLDKSKEDLKVAQDEAKAAKDEAEKAVKAKEQAETDKAAAEAERDAERANIKEIKRVAAFIARTGKSEEDAKAFVKTWASVSDEQFESVLSLTPAKAEVTPEKPAETSPTKPAKAAKSKDDEDDEDDDEEDDAMANEQVLEGAQAEQNVQLGASSDSEVESTRANLSNYLGNMLSKNRSKKRTK